MQDAIKNTAAVLHQLHGKDRDWILGKLPRGQKNALRHALADLKRVKSMGQMAFEDIYELVKTVPMAAHADVEESVPVDTPEDTMTNALNAATMKQVQVVIEGMSPIALAQILAATDNAKIRRAVAAVGDDFSHQVKVADTSRESKATSKVVECLAEYVTQKLGSV